MKKSRDFFQFLFFIFLFYRANFFGLWIWTFGPLGSPIGKPSRLFGMRNSLSTVEGMQGFDVLKDAIRRVAARTMGVDYEYLVKKWSGNYCPDKHLFEWKTDPIPDKPGSSLATFHPIWFFDAVIWEKIGKVCPKMFQLT